VTPETFSFLAAIGVKRLAMAKICFKEADLDESIVAKLKFDIVYNLWFDIVAKLPVEHLEPFQSLHKAKGLQSSFLI
jgi:hypothetical protein